VFAGYGKLFLRFAKEGKSFVRSNVSKRCAEKSTLINNDCKIFVSVNQILEIVAFELNKKRHSFLKHYAARDGWCES